MKRRDFTRKFATISGLGVLGDVVSRTTAFSNDINAVKQKQTGPLAITMWDFSWLERRWPGAGYEDWDKILDELVERGYNAVRIDAYPHLVSENPAKEWTLIPVWNQQVWGSPDINKVVVQPALNTFISKCRDRNIKVALSTWYREDIDNTRMKINSPEKMGENWLKTMDTIGKDNLTDNIIYVDLCNEWPGDLWAPFFKNDPPGKTWGYWHTDKSIKWMKESIEVVRRQYPDIPLCYSFDSEQVEYYSEKNLSFFDLIEHHVWMAKENNGEFFKAVRYNYGRFSPQDFKNLVEKGEKTYRQRPQYWQKLLTDKIKLLAENARNAKLPLITTECWSVVDYKDWPLLNWDWVKDLCELGTLTAAATGQWIAVATSNFCGPQFAGMWRDIKWHRSITDRIKASKINESSLNDKIKKRISH
ncbi:MAG: cellulase-like family protein [Sedimentisphaerales bacterium]|jgi:hypothetical protein